MFIPIGTFLQPLHEDRTKYARTISMGRRERLISKSILRAIFNPRKAYGADEWPSLVARILAFFAIFNLTLARYRAALFRKLRNETWGIEEEEYKESFRSPSHNKRTDLIAIGNLGYSGSVCLRIQRRGRDVAN